MIMTHGRHARRILLGRRSRLAGFVYLHPSVVEVVLSAIPPIMLVGIGRAVHPYLALVAGVALAGAMTATVMWVEDSPSPRVSLLRRARFVGRVMLTSLVGIAGVNAFAVAVLTRTWLAFAPVSMNVPTGYMAATKYLYDKTPYVATLPLAYLATYIAVFLVRRVYQ